MSDPKTIADVLDKSIDKLSGGAAEIAKAVKHVAPHAWGVAVRQQVVEGAVAIGASAALVLTTVVFYRLLGAKMHERSEPIYKTAYLTDAAVGLRFAFGALLFACVLGAAQSACGLMKILNPEYYAARAILEAVK